MTAGLPNTPDAPSATAPSPARDREATVERLRTEPLEVLGRMPWSSNATFLVCVGDPPEGLDPTKGLDKLATSGALLAVYKPGKGEQPLWDFPERIFTREVATYELAVALGWDLVPPTVYRSDDDAGVPLGEGSLQQFVHVDFSEHYFTMLEDESLHPQLRRICVFDLLSNNTDRKGGHILVDGDRHLWCIDNGLSFHQEFKLRTVVWDFAEELIPDDLRDDVCRVLLDGPDGLAGSDGLAGTDGLDGTDGSARSSGGRGQVPESVARYLDPFERDALLTRARAVVAEGRFPSDHSGRRHPWPLV